MAKRRTVRGRRGSSGATGADIEVGPMRESYKKSIRGILKDLVGDHSTEIALRLREGLTSKNLRLALKYLTMAAAYVDGKPVETHRMVGLQDSPVGAYDLSKLDPAKQKALLKLLREAKDHTEPKGDA